MHKKPKNAAFAEALPAWMIVIAVIGSVVALLYGYIVGFPLLLQKLGLTPPKAHTAAVLPFLLFFSFFILHCLITARRTGKLYLIYRWRPKNAPTYYFKDKEPRKFRFFFIAYILLDVECFCVMFYLLYSLFNG